MFGLMCRHKVHADLQEGQAHERTAGHKPRVGCGGYAGGRGWEELREREMSAWSHTKTCSSDLARFLGQQGWMPQHKLAQSEGMSAQRGWKSVYRTWGHIVDIGLQCVLILCFTGRL